MKFFLSYRRNSQIGFSGRLYDYLVKKFGNENVFRDIENIGPGETFENKIVDVISKSDVIIVLIGENWIGKQLFRKNRIKREDDWVRKEVEHSLETGKLVIPVLIEDSRLPDRIDLPKSLHSLLSVNAARLTDRNWDTDISKILNRLEFIENTNELNEVIWKKITVDNHKSSKAYYVYILLFLIFIGTIVGILYSSNNKVEFSTSDYKTWGIPEKEESRSDLAFTALNIALLELKLGVSEVGGENKGYNVEKYTERFKVNEISWSAAFVSWCYVEAFKRNNNGSTKGLYILDSPGTEAIGRSIQKSNLLFPGKYIKEALPGDILFLRRGSREMAHAEIIYVIKEDSIYTIGGNTNDKVIGRVMSIKDKRISYFAKIEQPDL